MNEVRRPLAFLDASVLYPALLRNLLLRLAVDGLYRAFWSARVQDEWTAALLRDRHDLQRASIERTRRLMEAALDDAMVGGYEHMIDEIALPDVDDRHVLAAAIHCGAHVIVTANLRHFPVETLALHGIEPQHPDAFVSGLLTAFPNEVLGTMRRLRQGLKNPPLTPVALLAAMSRQGLDGSAGALGLFIDVL